MFLRSTRRFLQIVAVVVLSMGLTSCKFFGMGDDHPVQPDTSAELQQTVANSTWVVASFMHDGVDVTADFASYRVVFAEDGTVGILNTDGTSIVTGTWEVGYDDGGVKLWLTVNDDTQLYDFDEDWYVVSHTNDRIELSEDDDHVNGDDGDDDDDDYDDDDDQDEDDSDDDDDDDTIVLVRAQP